MSSQFLARIPAVVVALSVQDGPVINKFFKLPSQDELTVKTVPERVVIVDKSDRAETVGLLRSRNGSHVEHSVACDDPAQAGVLETA